MSSVRLYRTGNSHTRLPFKDAWLVLDLGSGHNPHPRADVLADRFLLEDKERSGQAIVLPAGRAFAVADACALPFRDNAFDYVICSHVAEHIEDIDGFCGELNRTARAGYIETPSRFAETLRHAPNHRWFVSGRNGCLHFEPTPNGYPLGWFGKLFYSLYFYRNLQAEGRDVFALAHGMPGPLHYVFRAIRLVLVWLWLLAKPLTYTRFQWEEAFSWEVK